jgi:hypothetical protein
MKLDKKDSEPVPEACTTQKNETAGLSRLPRYPEVSDQKSEENGGNTFWAGASGLGKGRNN